MEPVVYLSEGHRSDIMVQASINNERNFDRVADALIIQHSRLDLREIHRRAKDKGKGKDGFKRVDNPDARWFRGRGKGKHTGSGKSGAGAHHTNRVSVVCTQTMKAHDLSIVKRLHDSHIQNERPQTVKAHDQCTRTHAHPHTDQTQKSANAKHTIHTDTRETQDPHRHTNHKIHTRTDTHTLNTKSIHTQSPLHQK